MPRGCSAAQALLYVSPGQINFLVPDGVAAGTATFTVAGGAAAQSFTATVQAVEPGLFSMNGTGSGVAAALAVAVQAGNPQVQSPVPVFQCGNNGCVSVPIALGVDQPVYVSFYGTGIRNRSSLGNVTVTINGVSFGGAVCGACRELCRARPGERGIAAHIAWQRRSQRGSDGGRADFEHGHD